MKAFLASIIALAAMAANGEDMQKYLNDTQQFVRQRRYEEALQRFIWFHEHALEHDPAMSGVRLSFALGYWKSLGDTFPPAKVALVELRDRTVEEMAGEKASFALFHDAAAINRTLGENDKTVELFRSLDRARADLAQTCWPVAKDAVIGARDYQLARKYIGDPATAFDRVKQMYEVTRNLEGRRPAAADGLKKWNEKHFVDESLQLIAFALAIKEPDAAKAVQQRALAVLDDPRLRNALPTAD